MINLSLKKQGQGQGLVESLIVILFISVSVITLISFQRFLSTSTNLTQQLLDANILAVKQLETLRDYQVLNTQAGYTSYQNIASGNSSTTLGNTNYTITWTVTSNTDPTYKTLSVVVSWTDRNGTARSMQLVTRVAGLDPGSPGAFM